LHDMGAKTVALASFGFTCLVFAPATPGPKHAEPH
jgi:hypothetical protein